MAFTYDSQCSDNRLYTSGSVSSDSTLDLAVGDFVVVAVFTNDKTVYCNSVTDDASPNNTYTVRTSIGPGGSYNITLTIAYSRITTAKNGATITAGFTTGTATKSIIVMVFNADVGNTVTEDDSASSTGYAAGSGEITTGSFDTTGTDELVICHWGGGNASVEWSNLEVPNDTAVDATFTGEGVSHHVVSYRILSGAVSAAVAAATINDSNAWCAEVVAFKSEAAASRIAALMYHYMNH